MQRFNLSNYFDRVTILGREVDLRVSEIAVSEALFNDLAAVAVVAVQLQLL